MMSEQHKYEEICDYARDEVEAAIENDSPEQLSRIVIGVSMHSSDARYAEGLCMRLATHVDSTVRGNAVLGFGHLARRFGKLNALHVKPIIESALQDDSEYVRGQAWAAADDVTHFLGWAIAGFDEKA